MSTSRVSDAGSGGGVQSIPSGSRKVVQSLKEIINCPEVEIYATLKECNMDPNEAVNRLLSQDPFHEVKRKREKKKEGKDNSDLRARGANISSNRGSKSGTDRHLSRGASVSYNVSESSLHGKSTYKKENGSAPYASSISSAPVTSGNNRSRGPPGVSDGTSVECKGSLLGTADGVPSAVQPSSGYQSAWISVPGQASMADIVRMGTLHNKSSTPNASQPNVQEPSTTESLHNLRFPADHAPKVHQSDVSSVQHVPTTDEWPSIEKPASTNVVSIAEYNFDSELHAEASGPFDGINRQSEAEQVQESEDDDIESSGGNDVGSIPIPRRKIPEDDSRGASLFENEMHKHMGSYQSEAHDFERHGDDEVGVSVSSVSRNFQQLSLEKDDTRFQSEENAPSVVIPDHLQVQTAACSHLSFGSFGSGMGAAYASGTMASVPVETNLEEPCSEVDISSAVHLDNRQPEYYIDDSLRNAPEGGLFRRTSASADSHDAPSASQPEELKTESAEVVHGNKYPFPSSNPGYTFDEAQRLNAAFNQTSSQMQNLAPFSNVMNSYSNSLPSTLLTANVNPTRESDLQYSPFPVVQPAPKYGTSVSAVGASAISLSEALKTAGFSSLQPAQETVSGNSGATGPPLPQQLPVHPYSQHTLPLGPYANMIGYPFLPQSYAYMPSAFQQSLAGSNSYNQSVAALLPQYKSSVSVSSLPQPAAVAPGYGANTTPIPGNYPMNTPAAPSGATLSYDDVFSSQHKESSHLLSLQQQNENQALWRHGPNSRTPAIPTNAYYNYQGQNQQPSGFRQGQQQSQHYGAPAYPNLYHSQTGILLEQQQNPRDGPRGGSQGQPRPSQIWPNNY